MNGYQAVLDLEVYQEGLLLAVTIIANDEAFLL